MGKFMEHATSVMKQYADKVAFLNEKREMTHGELDRESGQIYAWLKKQGIGREDFVQIVLPRGPECIAALMGVLRAGAAFLISEKGYPEKRIEFMRRDAGAKIVLEEDTYRQILREEEPLPGYEETSPHDAAFACYTSGSTGTPKGILHEYGTLDLMQHTVPLETSYGDNPHMLVTSMSFILSFVDIVNAFHYLRPMYIVSSEMLRDVTAMSRLMEEKQAYSSTMSPSYWRLCNKPGLPLKKVIVAGEPARGIYHEGENLVIRNFYSLTEAACCILGMELDRPYEDAPLGMPIIDALDVHLENPDGSRVEGPGEGELCLNNTYMRCYINLPEKTQEIIRNGVFHTGDIARRMEDGTYFLIGRKDDMFKINGNRVEPGEIEGAVQKITGLKTVVAKGFDVEGRSFICLYYLRSEAVERNLLDGENLKADISALSEMLPRYMLPTYYIPLEKMPLNDSGKIARRLLSAPELKDVAGEYVPPANEAEQEISEMMAEILGAEKIGAESDFYQMGGDSLRSIRLIALAGKHGYRISANDLYYARTPRALALLCQKDNTDIEEKNRKAQEKDMPLLQIQTFWQDKLVPEQMNSPLAVIKKLLRIKDGTDPDKLRTAVDKVYQHHPILLTRLVNLGASALPQPADEKYVQRYDPGMYVPTDDIRLSEEELWNRVEKGKEPFDADKGIFHYRAILRTEKASYLYLAIHHALTDGTGIRTICDNIYRAYMGEDLPPDPYFAVLEDEFGETADRVRRETEEYISRTFKGELPDDGCSGMLDPDLPGAAVPLQNVYESFPRKAPDENIRHLTAIAMAMAKCNGSNRAVVNWVYSGRDDNLKSNSASGYAKSLPVYLVREDGDTPKMLMQKVREQVSFTASHSSAFNDSFFLKTPPANTMLYLYQKDIFVLGEIGKLVEEVQLPFNWTVPMEILSLTLIDTADKEGLERYFIYSPGYYSEEKARDFMKFLHEALEELDE